MTPEVFSTGADTAPRARRRSRLATATSQKILIPGNFPQTVTVVRSLARAGFTPTVGRGRASFTAYSCYTAEVRLHPPVGQTAEIQSRTVNILLSYSVAVQRWAGV